MTTSLDDIAFLANSENRIAVLTELATTSRTRQDLLNELDVSRVTLTRILNDFESRYWVKQTDGTYAVTPLGEWVCDEITAVLDVLETERQLQKVIQWFPIDAVDFNIEWLHNAEIIRPTESDPTAPLRRAAAQLRDGRDVRVLTMQVTASFFDLVGDPLVHGEMTLEAVATPSVYETIANDPQLADTFQEVADTPDADFLVTDDVPLVVHIVDNSVLIGLTDDETMPRAAIESCDETIHSWAIKCFETYAESAKPVAQEVVAT